MICNVQVPHKGKQTKQLTAEQREAIELEQKNKTYQLLDADDDDGDDSDEPAQPPPPKVNFVVDELGVFCVAFSFIQSHIRMHGIWCVCVCMCVC